MEDFEKEIHNRRMELGNEAVKLIDIDEDTDGEEDEEEDFDELYDIF